MACRVGLGRLSDRVASFAAAYAKPFAGCRSVEATTIAVRAQLPEPALHDRGGKRVAEVAELLQEMGVPASQPGRACKRLKTRHGFTEADVFERPRRGEKKGGRLQWVGTRAALVKLWVDC